MISSLPDAPHDWLVVPLGEVVEILDSRRVPVNGKERASREGDVPYYGATGQVGWIDDYLFDEELVLLGEDAAPFLDGTKPVAYTIRGKSWVNNHAHVLRALGRMPSEFLKHQLNQIEYRPFVSGTTRLKLSQTPMRRISLVIPPRQEQERIADALDSYFSRLDDAVATLERVQRNLKRYRASVLNAAVEGRLVPTEAELARKEGRDYEPADALLARILEERKDRWIEQEAEKGRAKAETKATKAGKAWTTVDDQAALTGARAVATKKYKEPARPDTTDLPELPEGWCWTNVDQLSFVIRGASPRPAGDPKYFGGAIPWITVGDLTADESPHLYSVPASVTEAGKQASRYIEPDTLLLTNSGATLGVPKITMIGGCINDGSVAMLFLEYPLKLYLHFYLVTQTKKLRDINQGAAQPNLNTTIVRNICVPLPPTEEQARVTQKIMESLSVQKHIETQIERQVVRAKRLRQSILKWAFEGKLVDQDPSDEPALVLLDRIKTEREKAQSAAKAKKKPGRTKRKKTSA